MGPAVPKAAKNAMVHLFIVEVKTFRCSHCNGTSVLFKVIGGSRRVNCANGRGNLYL